MRKYKNFLFFGLWKFLLKYKKKYKKFLNLGLESSISRNIGNFFRLSLFYFSSLESSLLKCFILRARKSYFPKHRKSFFFWENKRKFHFLKYKKSFFWENIRNFFRVGFFRKKYKKFFLGKNSEDWGRKVD